MVSQGYWGIANQMPDGIPQGGGIGVTANVAATTQVSPAVVYGRPLLLGHRGARALGRFPIGTKNRNGIPSENTLACFEYALAQGAEGFEFDVRVTRDERLVLCHNAWSRGRNVSKATHSALCSGGSLFPCLEEVLASFGKRAHLDIEVKVAGAEKAIAHAIRECPPQCGYLVSSFLPEVLLSLHAIDASLPLGYVSDRASSLPFWRELPVQVVLPHYKLVTAKLIEEVHRCGIQVFTWTVNRENDMRRLGGWGIDGVISDDPVLLTETFRRHKAAAAAG